MLTEAFAHDIAGPDLHEWLRRTTETLRLRAFVVAATREQVIGLARELRDDFGLNADGVVAGEIAPDGPIPGAARRADVVITTAAHTSIGERVSASLGRPLLTIDVHPDLVAGEWSLLLRQPVWAIVPTPEVAAALKATFASLAGLENLKILVLGRDDLGSIPEGAPTYVTPVVREQLPDLRIRGRVLPAARTIATESGRTIFRFIVRANIEAMRAVTPTLKDYSSKPAPRRLTRRVQPASGSDRVNVGALPLFALYCEITTHVARELAADRETESNSLIAALIRIAIHLHERIEDRSKTVRWNSAPRVGDVDDRAVL